MGIYADDIPFRYPDHTATTTLQGSRYVCEVTDDLNSDAVVCRGRGATAEEAELTARWNASVHLGGSEVKPGAPCLAPSNDSGAVQDLYDLLDRQVVFDYGDVNGPVTLEFQNGNGLYQEMTLTGNLTTGDIDITPPNGPRSITFSIVQDGTGGRTISADAWPGTVDWGSKGPPPLGGSANDRCFIALVHWNSVIYGHYDTNVF